MNQFTEPSFNLETDAEVIISQSHIDQAIQTLADELNRHYSSAEYDGSPIKVYCIMNGGLYFTGQLLRYLTFPLQLNYLHATRYGHHTSGAALEWKCRPETKDIRGHHILLLDDIFDEGLTLEAIDSKCRQCHPKSVHSAVLTDKLHKRKPTSGFKPDFIGLAVEDRYLFGCGMDYQGLYRNLPAIYALKS
ncbi:hypoxanthine-guanine phosphoribosyltransferase [Kangiella marina]|uniref:Hypoxanthine-guanine phosphoribosyltransferase n=1 Tax=Kangiella marina TaxID=1079178 RepID=A0ABP8IP24_9GAMM